MSYGFDSSILDGNCVTGVLVRAPAADVAAQLGKPFPVCRDHRITGGASGVPKARVMKVADCDWCSVELGRMVPVGSWESEPVFAQAIAALRGEYPEVSLDYTAPVTTAARLSQQLGCATIGFWASSEGPWLQDGMVLFESGTLQLAMGPVPPEVLEQAHRVVVEEIDGEAIRSLMESPGHYRFTAGSGGRMEQGRVTWFLDEFFRGNQIRHFHFLERYQQKLLALGEGNASPEIESFFVVE